MGGNRINLLGKKIKWGRGTVEVNWKGRREGKGREGKGMEERSREEGREREGGGKTFFLNVGKKTSLSYFSFPFLLHFAMFSVESSLPFSSLM